MVNSQENKKVYLEVVGQLREIIKTDRLVAGDKIPSERELSERLQAGRSSVREALRALELLGLIETKRGEGTFIRDFRDHQLVQLLSTFILQDEEAKRDVLETKAFLELDSIRLIIKRAEHSELIELKNWVSENTFQEDEFFEKIVRLSNNRLILKIWLILKEYYFAIQGEQTKCSKRAYVNLIEAMISGDVHQASSVYSEQIRNLSLD